MEYQIRQKEFYGLLFHVSPATLIPRPDTEILVDTALDLGRRKGRVREERREYQKPSKVLP